MQRLKTAAKPNTARRINRSGVVRIAVPARLEQKIELISSTVCLPKEVFAAEAIRRGMEVLVKS
jgi:hypothetical protein